MTICIGQDYDDPAYQLTEIFAARTGLDSRHQRTPTKTLADMRATMFTTNTQPRWGKRVGIYSGLDKMVPTDAKVLQSRVDGLPVLIRSFQKE